MAPFDRLRQFFPAKNGNGKHGDALLLAPVTEAQVKALPPVEAKGVTLRAAPGIDFFAPDRVINDQMIRFRTALMGAGAFGQDHVDRETAYALAAYAHVAIRYRMRKVSEPPLMVTEEDAEGSEEWVQNHPIDQLLDEPSPDFDMGELLQRSQAYLDMDGQLIWVKDKDAGARLGRLTPFTASEFRVEPRNGRLRGVFIVETNSGPVELPPERVVFFQEVNPAAWNEGQSLLDVALAWLNLSQSARVAVRDLLANALFPSVIIQTDPSWRPQADSPEWQEFVDSIHAHAEAGNRGDPLVLTGGGSATVVTTRLRDLIPGDILDRVESVVSAVFGVPAIVLQFQVGMENSPWSQMAEARRMCYEDTIEPLWRFYEKALTRQLLRAPLAPGGQPLETNRRRKVRFDTSDVRALQVDMERQAGVQEKLADIASVNERRAIVLLEPEEGEEYDKVPEPSKPAPPGLPGQLPGQPVPDPDAEDEADDEGAKALALPPEMQWKRWDVLARSLEPSWHWDLERLLEQDKAECLRLVQARASALERAGKSELKAAPPVEAILQSLLADQKRRWKGVLSRLVSTTAHASSAQLAGDIGVSFDLLNPGVEAFTKREAAWLITSVTDTTREAVRGALQKGLAAGESIPKLRERISGLDSAFGKSRATLIARTEVTRVSNGAQESALTRYAERSGKRVMKTWLATNDDRVRDEHWDMNGVKVGVDEDFDTEDLGPVPYPQAPNCRCTLTYEVEDA